jgi:hypothetical protein
MFQQMLTIEEMSRKLRPILGEKMDQLYMNYSFCTDLDKKRDITNFIHALYMKYINQTVLKDHILLEPPTKEMMRGEYPLGVISYANNDLYNFNLREHDWQRHVCITGMSGSGKTTLAFQIIRNFIVKQKPFMILDWKKSFRPLMLIDSDILLYTTGNEGISNSFKVNINRPPRGVPPKEWISILTDIILESFSASHGTAKIIAEVMDEAFRDFKVYQGSENYPNWYQIYDRLREKENDSKTNRRETEWLTSAVRIGHMLTFGDYGKSICTKGADEMTVEEIMDKKVIFELYSLNTVQKKFFCEYLLTYIYKLKKNMNMISEVFKHAIIVDEAHNIFLKERPTFMRETVTDMIYREMREYGESLICLDQHVSKLSETVIGNSACIIAFQQILPQDVEAISTLTQLRDKRNYFSMLDIGQAIVRLAERFNDPFMIKVPYIELKKENVDNEYVIDRMKKFVSQYRLMKAIDDSTEENIMNKEVAKLRGVYHRSNVAITPAEIKKIHFETEPKPIGELLANKVSGEEKVFLELVSKEELSVSQAYKKLGLSARKGNNIKDLLVKKKLIEVKEEKSEKGWRKLLVPATVEISLAA